MSNFPSYISQCFSLLKSGGYLELQEIDASTWWDINQEKVWDPEPSWMTEMRSVFLQKGLEMDLAVRLGQYVKDAGFVDVEVKEYRWMFGNWEGHPETEMISKVATTWQGKAMFGAYKRVCGEGKTKEEMEWVEKDMMEKFGWEDGKHKRFYVVVGRKP